MDEIDINLLQKFRSANPDAANLTDDQILSIFAGSGEAEIEPTAAGNYGSIEYGSGGMKPSFNILEYLPFGEKSISGSIMRGIGNLVPKMDPRQKALRDLYGYDNIGRVPTGLMEGYNPVSGGLMYTLTGGRIGEPPTYGLQKAYDKRRSTIENTLGNKYGLDQDDIDAIYAGTYDEESDNFDTTLIQRLRDLKTMQDKELQELQGIQPTGGTTTTGTTNVTSDPGDGGGPVFTKAITTTGGDRYAPGDYTDVKGSLADPREKMDYYADGGRVYLNLGGLASLL